MTMDSIFYQPGDIALIPEISQLDRISRLAALGPEDTVAGLHRADFTAESLQRRLKELPPAWDAQHKLLGFPQTH